MTFRRGSQLDPSQVEDFRGRRIGTRGMAVGGGGAAGRGGRVIALRPGGGGGGTPGTLAGPGVGRGVTSGREHHAHQRVQTGADANARDDCGSWATWTASRPGGPRPSPPAADYEPSKTRFFSGAIDTGCGAASSDVGPFYCPADRYVYIDLGFFDELKSKFGATGGPFAQAYILAHEYGHHVQDLLGLLQSGGGGAGATGQSVRTELQADCLAGVWANHAVDTGYLEPITDAQVADALNAAAAVGDDRIQAEFQGRVSPESWTTLLRPAPAVVHDGPQVRRPERLRHVGGSDRPIDRGPR